MAIQTLDSMSLTLLCKKLDDWITKNSLAVGTGNSIVSNDAAATAMNYAAACQYIVALHHVKDLCLEVEDELLGRNQDKKGTKSPAPPIERR